MSIGSGCQVHLRADELPSGRLIVSVSRHVVAVIDGIIHDNHDCSRGGTRCVYGYWKPQADRKHQLSFKTQCGWQLRAPPRQ
jgi:hypothetical protein